MKNVSIPGEIIVDGSMTIKAVVFDWDGVFIDTSELIWKSYNHLHDIGLSKLYFKSREEFFDFFDTNWLNNTKKMGIDSDEMVEKAIYEYKLFFENLEHPTEIYPPMIEIVKWLSAKDIKVGIASNIDNSNLILHSILQKHDLNKYFNSIVGADRSKALKPDPAGLLMCMNELNVKPENVLFVGDSINDIKAGKNANVQATIAVSFGFAKKEVLLSENPDYVAENCEELMEIIENARKKH